MPFGIAIAAGAFAALNPCEFPLLPAYLSLYIGADEDALPAASTRRRRACSSGCSSPSVS